MAINENGPPDGALLGEREALETKRVADLALGVARVRDSLLEEIREADLDEPNPSRGEHDPIGNLALESVLAAAPAFVALREALDALPRDILDKVSVVARVGRGDIGITDWDEALGTAAQVKIDEIVAILLSEPNLHEHLRKGLYELGAA